MAFEVGLDGGVLRAGVAIVILVGVEEMVVEFDASAAFAPLGGVESVSMDRPAEGLSGPGDDGVGRAGGTLSGIAEEWTETEALEAGGWARPARSSSVG